MREDDLEGIPNLLRLVGAMADFDSDEAVRLWVDGKLVILLWMIGDGSRSPVISDVPSLLGLEGLREVFGR